MSFTITFTWTAIGHTHPSFMLKPFWNGYLCIQLILPEEGCFLDIQGNYRDLFLALNSFSLIVLNIFTSNSYPDATPEELQQGDNVCIICREEMTTGCKKLPCNHIFHTSCLRSWFQRQQTCPTCRMDVLRPQPPPQPQQPPPPQVPQPPFGFPPMGVPPTMGIPPAPGVPPQGPPNGKELDHFIFCVIKSWSDSNAFKITLDILRSWMCINS